MGNLLVGIEHVGSTSVKRMSAMPCIDIGFVNKHYDLALASDALATNHYIKLSVKADTCLKCGYCENRCPFSVKQENRTEEINTYFRGNFGVD